MQSIVLFCLYFGKINMLIHRIWLQSCSANPSIDFLLISDNAEALNLSMPENVRGVYMTWDDCVKRVKSRFDFEIALDNPYKLCDFKPAYGDIFRDYIEGYDFWGHLDSTDTVLGDLRKFLTEDILSAYDKVHSFGHLTLYRNTPENNRRYLIEPSCGTTIRDLFVRPEVTGFDEMDHPWSINTIYKENGFSLIERIDSLSADLFPSRWPFEIWEDQGEKVPRIFEWDHGKLFDVSVRNAKIQRREFGYIHFQKRKMSVEVTAGEEHFYIIPNRFIPASGSLTCEQIEEWSKDRLYLDPLKGRVKRIINYARKPDVFFRKLREKL